MGRKSRVGIAVAVAAAGRSRRRCWWRRRPGFRPRSRPDDVTRGQLQRRRVEPTPTARWSPRASRPSASTRSATRRSGATRCTSTRRSPARRTAASGPGVSPKTALSVGLKVDVDALPAAVQHGDRRRPGQPGRPGDHAGPAQAQRGGRRQGLLRPQRQAQLGRHRVRPVPLHRGRLLRARASATGWTAGPTATSTSARSSASSPNLQPVAVAAAHRRGDGAQGARRLGTGQVRRRAVPGRQGVPAQRHDRRRR